MKKSKTSTRMRNNGSMKQEVGSKTLAIDPGFDRVGVAIVVKENNKEKLLFSKCIETNRKESQAKRLEQIGEEVKEVIKKWKPETLAIEKLFFNQNTTSALRVAEARGVIIYEAICSGLEIHEYSPQEIKLAVTGYGKAAKAEVQNMAMRLLGLSIKSKYDDEADAIALGLTHLASYKQKRRLSTD